MSVPYALPDCTLGSAGAEIGPYQGAVLSLSAFGQYGLVYCASGELGRPQAPNCLQ
jgi:hypothetical protein